MKSNTLLYVGLGLGGYLLLTGGLSSLTSIIPGTTAATTPGAGAVSAGVPNVVQLGGTYVLSGSPAPPSSFPTGLWQTVKNGYYTQYEYPAHLLVNPNVGQSSYTLTDAEATQYLNNYLDVKQFAQSATSVKAYGSALAAAKYHWHTYQPGEQRTFLPMMPTFTGTFSSVQIAAGINPNAPAQSSSGGSSWVGTALSIAGSVIALLGPNDAQLNKGEVMVLATSGAVLKQILPYYYNTDQSKLALAIDARFDGLLKQYS